MKVHGNIDLLQNQIQQCSLQQETDFPSSPVVGRILFKNKIVYICVDLGGGTPVWVPLTREIETYIHTQSSPASTWNIEHNLNAGTVNVQVYNTSDQMVIPNEITIVDNNNININFGTSTAGRAIIIVGSQDGNLRPNYSYIHYQTTLSSTWTVLHGLGYNPIVRVFIGQNEVQPLSIVHNSNSQLTITFSSPQTGQARCI
jgi:hypothetical protein